MRTYKTLDELIDIVINNNKKVHKELVFINVPVDYYILLLENFKKRDYTNFQMYLHNIFEDDLIKIGMRYNQKQNFKNRPVKKNLSKKSKLYHILSNIFLKNKKKSTESNYYVVDFSRIRFYKG